jgi:hypothetical protein
MMFCILSHGVCHSFGFFRVRVTHQLAQRFAFAKHGRWAGVDTAWEQEKLEARKLLDAKRATESHLSSAPWKDGGLSFFTKEHLAV